MELFQFENESKFDIRSSREEWEKALLYRALFHVLTLRGKMILLLAPRARSLSFFSKIYLIKINNPIVACRLKRAIESVKYGRQERLVCAVLLFPGKTETSFSATMALICFTEVYFYWRKEREKVSKKFYTNLCLLTPQGTATTKNPLLCFCHLH